MKWAVDARRYPPKGKRHIPVVEKSWRRYDEVLCGAAGMRVGSGKAVDSLPLCGTCLRIGQRIARQVTVGGLE